MYGFPLKPYNTSISNTTWPDADSAFCFGMTSFPTNENALLFCTNVGLYYTANGDDVVQLNSNYLGKDELTFTAKNGTTAKKSMQRVSSTGVDVICTQTLVTDPFDSNHLIMGCTDIGMLQSYDNGESWYYSLNEWKNGSLVNMAYELYTNTCFDVHFDTQNKNVVYGIWSLAKTVPYAPVGDYLTSDSRFGISYDGGLSWTMKKITPDGRCLPCKMQVVYEGADRVIYIATDSHGFFVTRDLGETFTPMNDGIDISKMDGKDAIWGLDIVVCDMGIFAITGGNASVGDANHMLYKWNEGASRFEKIGLPSVVSSANGRTYYAGAVRDIEYDAKNQCLYLACTANIVNNDSTMIKAAGGVWKYAGGEFELIYDDKISVSAVNLDGEGRLYVTELNGRVARLDENYETELLIDDFFHIIKRVCFGADGNTLYIPTWGGGTERVILEDIANEHIE